MTDFTLVTYHVYSVTSATWHANSTSHLRPLTHIIIILFSLLSIRASMPISLDLALPAHIG